jgi:pyrroloquinoline-quinone synthase
VCYHDLHPFHDMLHDGKLNKGQVQAWALNRYIYRAAIPRKDASLNCDVHRRDLECPVYVDSSRPWRKDAAMV